MDIKAEIIAVIKNSIENFFHNKTVKVKHPLDLIFPRERRIRSLIGGLETSLGTQVWEPVAKLLASKNGFVIRDEKQLNSAVPILPESVLSRIAEFEEKKLNDPSIKISDFYVELRAEFQSIHRDDIAFQKIRKGQGIDLWLQKDQREYLIDIKTTQINAGGGPKFCSNFLKWSCYRALTGSTSDVICILAFPFNPHPGNFWRKEKGKSAPLIPSEEARVGDEFWNLIYGQPETESLLMDCFRELGEQDYGSQFNQIFTPDQG